MQRRRRILGALLVGAGVLTLAWALDVWQWQDPVTALYTHWQQHKLAQSLDRELAAFRHPAVADGRSHAAARRAIAAEAQQFRRSATRGQAIGRIVIRRLGLAMVLVNGTDHDSLKKGPGRDPRSYMPGQNRLVYIAGHRTTYLAPFSHIDAIRPGDAIELKMPYATFVYRAVSHRIVASTDLSVLGSPPHELLELQACHPRSFATHRYIVYARVESMRPATGRS